MHTEKKRLDAAALDLESLDVEELEEAAGGGQATTEGNVNCGSCTCPPNPILAE